MSKNKTLINYYYNNFLIRNKNSAYLKKSKVLKVHITGTDDPTDEMQKAKVKPTDKSDHQKLLGICKNKLKFLNLKKFFINK